MRSPWSGYRNYRTRGGEGMPPEDERNEKGAGINTEYAGKAHRTPRRSRSLRFRADKLGDDAFGTGGEDVLCVERKERIERLRRECLPAYSRVLGQIGTVGTDREKSLRVKSSHGRTKAGRLLRSRLPSFATVIGKSGNAKSDARIRVIAAHREEVIFGGKSDREDSGRGVIRGDGDRSGRPGLAAIRSVKHSSGESSSENKELASGGYEQIGIACGESTFFGKCARKILRGQGIPTVAINGLQDEKFSIDRITKRKAFYFRHAGNGIEKESFVHVCELKFPRRAAIGGFVDPRFISFAARHEVGSGVADGNDAAEIKVRLAGDGEASPCRAIVERAENDAVRAGGPDGDVAGGGDFRSADAAQVGIETGGEDIPGLCTGGGQAKSERK